MWDNRCFCFIKKDQVKPERIRHAYLDLTDKTVDVFDMRESCKDDLSFGKSVACVKDWFLDEGSLYGRIVRNEDSIMCRGDIIWDICSEKVNYMPIRTSCGNFIGVALVDRILDDHIIWGEDA